jgi:hypothetical protein
MKDEYIQVDVESSGLDLIKSYPIEIAWMSESGICDEFLVKPSGNWGYWSLQAESIHGIKREQLLKDGISIIDACHRLNSKLKGLTVFSDAVNYDSSWLGTLFREGGIKPEFFISQMPYISRAGHKIPHRALADCKLYIDIIKENNMLNK